MKLVLAVVFAFFAAVALEATECRRVVRVQQQAVVVQHQAIVATPIVAAVFAPVAVTVPTYSIGYAPAAPDPNVQQLVAEIKQLRAQVQALTAVPQALKKEAIGEHPAVAVMRNKCANCHGAAAKEKGGGFALFDGASFAKLTDKQALNLARNVYSGRMPKNGKLTDEEVGQIMDWLDTIK